MRASAFGLLIRFVLRRRGVGSGFIRRWIDVKQLTLLHRTRVARLVKFSLTILTLIHPKISLVDQLSIVIQYPNDLLSLLLVQVSVQIAAKLWR